MERYEQRDDNDGKGETKFHKEVNPSEPVYKWIHPKPVYNWIHPNQFSSESIQTFIKDLHWSKLENKGPLMVQRNIPRPVGTRDKMIERNIHGAQELRPWRHLFTLLYINGVRRVEFLAAVSKISALIWGIS